MCFTPITLSGGDRVPCGRCLKCKQKRIYGWAFRLREESKIAHSAHFITLTYDNKHVPVSWDFLPTLYKRDLQLFFKRLRKAHGKNHRKIVYYAAGEYGGKTNRPHYHVILYNAKLELIDKAWNMGVVHYGKVEPASIVYTLKYINKKYERTKGRTTKTKNRDKIRTQQPCFSIMSKGIGISYINEKSLRFHLASITKNCYVLLPGNIKASLPRYYKEKIFSIGERNEIARYMEQRAEKTREDNFRKHGHKKNYLPQVKAAIEHSFKIMHKRSACKTL